MFAFPPLSKATFTSGPEEKGTMLYESMQATVGSATLKLSARLSGRRSCPLSPCQPRWPGSPGSHIPLQPIRAARRGRAQLDDSVLPEERRCDGLEKTSPSVRFGALVSFQCVGSISPPVLRSPVLGLLQGPTLTLLDPTLHPCAVSAHRWSASPHGAKTGRLRPGWTDPRTAPKRQHKAKAGDLIKIYRQGYQHWVVYIGDDEVVGFPGPKKENADGGMPTLVDGEAVVTRGKIWDVIGDNAFKVSNLWDDKTTPLEEAVIVKQAKEKVGQKLQYSWSGHNSEEFAKQLRYGDKVFMRATVCAFLCKRTHDAKPGDLIEFFRLGYRHWAVYVGNDEVVGLTSPNEGDGVIRNLINGQALVKRESLWSVMGDDDCKVNNLWDDECEPFAPEVIVGKTLEKEGQVMSYSLLSHNCEHFSTELRYGEAKSKQVHFFTLGFWS
ncbi:uncharacterized protein LOC141806806 [Halichoeres trimaculatus]|uniref:uncharacterized protein LOC141806806 n=1 Tax=Halichoeres trimaculatus TaxID=147232 RepID=UPI003D9E91A1